MDLGNAAVDLVFGRAARTRQWYRDRRRRAGLTPPVKEERVRGRLREIEHRVPADPRHSGQLNRGGVQR
jgi:hypothetical protein